MFNMLMQLRSGIKPCVYFTGLLSEGISINTEVNQGAIHVTTLFSISYAFQDCDISINTGFRTTGKVFDFTRFKTKSNSLQNWILELLFAEAADLVVHTEDVMVVMALFSRTSTTFGLISSLYRSIVVFTQPPGYFYPETKNLVQFTWLNIDNYRK